MKNYIATLITFFFMILNASLVFAQKSEIEMMKGMGGQGCLMCGAIGWGGMVLGTVLLLSISVALIILPIFLIRRRRVRNRSGDLLQKNYLKNLVSLFVIFLSTSALAQMEHSSQPHSQSSQKDKSEMKMKKYSYPMMASDCTEMEVFDPTMSMCMPFPMEGMPMKMLMLTGNVFVVGSTSEGPRGRKQVASPNMFMIDVGQTLGDRHYVNLDFMCTAERWTFPENGYPELLQIGETDAKGRPYLDGQHPHSSPIMGLTLSDTIRLGNGKNYLKIFIAPRGAATDGPIAFMHRPTGITNPDAPLGHHIGQDVGHISSTVLGGSLALSATRLQFSVFNGTEPEPTKVDLPIRTPNSAAFRVIQDFTPKVMGMASVAYVKDPEGEGIEATGENKPSKQWRLSASAYSQHEIHPSWTLYNSLIYGYITDYEHASALSSVVQEFWLKGNYSRVWSRIEFVQRTARQLEITSALEQDAPKWVTALTLGYTYALVKIDEDEFGVGGSITKDFLPGEFTGAYGGDPWAAKIFVQFRGMGMWHL